MSSVVISSGHGKFIRGAAGPEPWGLDEVNEARRVVERLAMHLREAGIGCDTLHDNVSTTQDANLEWIIEHHNDLNRDLDCSIHFNAYEVTQGSRGSECWHYSGNGETMELAAAIASNIAAAAGFPDRGPKATTSLAFLNGTEKPAVLVEVCFVDAKQDCEFYEESFDDVCQAIGRAIAEHLEVSPPVEGEWPDRPQTPPPGVSDETLFQTAGKCSWFGGPEDTGVDPDEGLAFIYDVDEAPHLFLEEAPEDASGLARRLDPGVFYVACRWDYDVTPKGMLASPMRKALVRAKGKSFLAWPADWGPHEDTGRVADLSPALLAALDLETDDTVEVLYPAPE